MAPDTMSGVGASNRGAVRSSGERLGEVATTDPTLVLLAAYSRDWVLPLFAECLESVDGSVSAEWFHDRVEEALRGVREDKEWPGDRSPASYCAVWVKQRWLDTEVMDGRVRYRLSAYALRALKFVREIADGESAVSGARLASLADAVRRLADMVNPDRRSQLQRIDAEIRALKKRRKQIADGQTASVSPAQMHEQLDEVLSMMRALPADFRQLRTMVEQRHRVVARDALADTPKAEVVESYLRERDLLSSTPQGQAYRRFTRMLTTSEEARALQQDVDQVLATDFGQNQLSAVQRRGLETMFSTLLAAELEVHTAYVRWTAALRGVVTRASHGRYGRLLTLSSQALEVAGRWVAADPRNRGAEVDLDVLGIGVLAVQDVSQLQLWRASDPQQVRIEITRNGGELPDSERMALRLAAGSSHRAVAGRINRLLRERGVVTAAAVFDDTPEEFRRLGTLVTMLDLAVVSGQVDESDAELVGLLGNAERQLTVMLPRLVFTEPITVKKESAR